MTTDMLKQS